MEVFIQFLLAFSVTAAVEISLALLLRIVRLIPRENAKTTADTVTPVFLMNLLTNPLLNLILITANVFLGRIFYLFFLAAGEVAVVIGEAFLLKLMCRLRTTPALAVSLALNAASFMSGTFIMPLVQNLLERIF